MRLLNKCHSGSVKVRFILPQTRSLTEAWLIFHLWHNELFQSWRSPLWNALLEELKHAGAVCKCWCETGSGGRGVFLQLNLLQWELCFPERRKEKKHLHHLEPEASTPRRHLRPESLLSKRFSYTIQSFLVWKLCLFLSVYPVHTGWTGNTPWKSHSHLRAI